MEQETFLLVLNQCKLPTFCIYIVRLFLCFTKFQKRYFHFNSLQEQSAQDVLQYLDWYYIENRIKNRCSSNLLGLLGDNDVIEQYATLITKRYHPTL